MDPTPGTSDPVDSIAAELRLPARGVATVVRLLGEGATVPFIARYRKEATGGLDEVQIRAVSQRHEYLVELEARRASVLAEIEKQDKLTPELRARLLAARTKGEIEDLYQPYKPKRRTRAAIAIERGLEPLARAMWEQVAEPPAALAPRFVDAARQVPDAAAALAGARDVCAERLADDAELRRHLRAVYEREAVVRVKKKKDFRDKPTKFDTYAEYGERAATLPSHRYLAIARGEAEDVLQVAVDVDLEAQAPHANARIPLRKGTPWRAELELAVADALKRLLAPALASELRAELKQRSDEQAIRVFAQNLRELLLAAPFGPKAVIGVDPGQRTGAKCAVVDETGRLLENDTIYLVQGAGALDKARATLRGLLARHRVLAIAVGNGTHGRETEAFVRDVVRDAGLKQPPVVVSVNEAGASVYSASELARSEFPDLDLTVRGAISIARRLQDPLAELVKIDPKSIGVGQYQHDVSEARLGRELDEVVESCVNGVGVELNTASAPLLARVAGLGPALAQRIVEHRDRSGRFESRKELRKVAGLGPKTFEQAAGFLRIGGAKNPLDASAVHPERYELVERMAKDLGVPLAALIGNAQALKRLDPARYKTDDVGDFTLSDIVAELHKPGRDPRKSFEPPRFRDDVRELTDLAPGMELEGAVTNVTAFGAFVDVGVHQDGLVHISQLADRFVKDPHEVVKVGDKLKVRVLSVDLERKRIALSAKRGEPAPRAQAVQPAFQNKPFSGLSKRR